MLDAFPQDPPSLHIHDYFCQQCGGLTHLPDQLIFEPVKLRWCICEWGRIQQYFAQAMDFYQGQEDDERKVEESGPLWVIENRAKEPA